MSNTYLSIVIPAYNEANRLPQTLKKVRGYLENQTYTSEVYVVNDGSTDETAVVVSELIKDWPAAKLISYDQNRGKGYAVKTGMLVAEGRWRLLMDADGSTDISQMDKFWEFTQLNPNDVIPDMIRDPGLDSGLRRNDNKNMVWNDKENFYEVIIGSRYLDKKSIKIKQPLSRRIVSRFGNFLIRILLGLNLKDTQCGFKLFSKKAVEDIFPQQTIDRWGFDMEILVIAKSKGYQIKEVAVDWSNAIGSQVSKTALKQTLKELRQIRVNLMKGKY